MKAYRVIHPERKSGMWYTADGIYNPVPYAKTANTPMDYCERFSRGGKQWLSAAESIQNLLDWFSAEDILWLHDNLGCGVFEIEATECEKLVASKNGVKTVQLIYTQESVVSQKNITAEFLKCYGG